MHPEQIVTIILNVTFIGAFIAIFFFTYGKTIEENVVKNQSRFIAKHLANDLRPFIDKETADKIVSQLETPSMDEADKKAKDINNNLKQQAVQVLIIGIIAGFGLAYYISSRNKLDFIHILKSNIIILFFVGLTYYLFLTYFGQNFLSADPNFVRIKVLSTIKEKLKSENELPIIPMTLDDLKALESKTRDLNLESLQKQPQPQPIPTQQPIQQQIPQITKDFLIR